MKTAFLGVGHMGGAIVTSLLSSKAFSPSDIILFRRTGAALAPFIAAGCLSAGSAKEAAEAADTVVIAVKPQNIDELFPQIRGIAEIQKKLFISLCAGVSCESICKKLGVNVPVVRTMPNTPLTVGKGVTAVCRNSLVSDSSYEFAKSLFTAGGTVLDIPEEKMNSIISVTGSSPAYVYSFIRAITEGAREQGLDTVSSDELLRAVCTTVIGSAMLAMSSGASLDSLIRAVCSPGGTTEKAAEALTNGNFEETVRKAMLACTKRAEELAGN